jgi:hypothetical protein
MIGVIHKKRFLPAGGLMLADIIFWPVPPLGIPAKIIRSKPEISVCNGRLRWQEQGSELKKAKENPKRPE